MIAFLTASLSNIKLIAIGVLGVLVVSLYLLWSGAASDRDEALAANKTLTEQLADFQAKQGRVNENLDTRAKEQTAIDDAIKSVREKLEHDHPESKDTPISRSTRDALDWLRSRSPEQR